ncbi:GNAT family N-acetyltransferase [Rhizomonospora bruguierae]|uniref:GNAT family N-acetyltransferase n=1 Tax=Rhizomonospora bruguierae TaxID=1581705 RepID=UPI001BCF3CA7|nr:GNAT family N-acetyltransferase [Micromonospora sp. NBRC 107566]
MLTITRTDGYELSTDPDRIDVARVYEWLSTDAYWATGRTLDVVQRAITGSVSFGVYRPGDGAQVAFARAVTDGATFAWVCDVYVDRSERGRGLGTWLVDGVRQELSGCGVRRLLLATLDAHGVYAKLGFQPLARPDLWMELDRR